MGKIYFLDMDWTLAIFPNKHGERGTKRYRTEEGFFRKLKPFAKLDAVNAAIAENPANKFILSNSPTEPADFDKDFWIDQFIPAMPKEHRIYNRGNLTAEFTKAQVAERILGRSLTENDILIDDSLTNLREWEAAGGTGIFKKNRYDKTSVWHGKSVAYMPTLARLIGAA